MGNDRITPETLNWERFEQEIVARIRALKVVSTQLKAPPAGREKFWDDLILPNLGLLCEFLENVEVEDDGDPGTIRVVEKATKKQ